MKIITTEAFAKNWKSWVHERKGSHMAVLLYCNDIYFTEETWHQKFLTELRLYCQADRIPWQKNGNVAERLRQIRPEYVIAIGNIRMLQEVCWNRNQDIPGTGEYEKRPPVVFLSTEIMWEQMIKRELLWIRDREGVTLYLGRAGWQEEDLVVMPSIYGLEQKQLFTALSRNVTELAKCMSGNTEERAEIRYLWEELAEPLWLRYGMPLWMGILLAVRYVDLLTETKTAKKLEQILERRKDRPEEMLWIPAEDIELLVNMAMAGIEMLPQQEHLSWQQIKEFYVKLSRSV